RSSALRQGQGGVRRVPQPAAQSARNAELAGPAAVMKSRTLWSALALSAAAAFATPALAATGLFASEDAASQSCGRDEVVWVDLDHGRFYHKAQDSYGKSGNGGYTCMKAAKLQYREAH